MHNVMVATDGSDAASRALNTGVQLAKAVGGALSIVTVGNARRAKEQQSFAQVEGDAADLAETFARQILSDAELQAQSSGVSPRIQLLWGDPAQAIIEAADRSKVDTIVVGRRGRGRLSGLLLGSVSQKLTSLAPCAVLVVP